MKKLFLFITIAGLLVSTSCKKGTDSSTPAPSDPGNGSISETDPNYKDIVVTEQQEALAIFLTGTWCWACGSQGIGAFDETLKFSEDKVNGISVQLNDNLLGTKTALETNLNKIFTHSGTPNYWSNKDFFANSYFTFQNKVKEVIGSSSKPTAAVGMQVALDGNKVTIKSKVKFTKDLEDVNYKLALFLVEDNIEEQQTYVQSPSTKKPMIHHRILRANASGDGVDHLGMPLNNTDSKIKAGDVFGKTSVAYLNPAWKGKNMKVVAVVWSTSGTIVRSIANSNSVAIQ